MALALGNQRQPQEVENQLQPIENRLHQLVDPNVPIEARFEVVLEALRLIGVEGQRLQADNKKIKASNIAISTINQGLESRISQIEADKVNRIATKKQSAIDNASTRFQEPKGQCNTGWMQQYRAPIGTSPNAML